MVLDAATGRALDVLEGVCGGASGSSLANSTGVAGAEALTATGEGSRRAARLAGTAADSAGDARCCCGCRRLAAVRTGDGDIPGEGRGRLAGATVVAGRGGRC